MKYFPAQLAQICAEAMGPRPKIACFGFGLRDQGRTRFKFAVCPYPFDVESTFPNSGRPLVLIGKKSS